MRVVVVNPKPPRRFFLKATMVPQNSKAGIFHSGRFLKLPKRLSRECTAKQHPSNYCSQEVPVSDNYQGALGSITEKCESFIRSGEQVIKVFAVFCPRA